MAEQLLLEENSPATSGTSFICLSPPISRTTSPSCSNGQTKFTFPGPGTDSYPKWWNFLIQTLVSIYDWTMLQPTLLPFVLWFHLLHILCNVPSGSKFSSWVCSVSNGFITINLCHLYWPGVWVILDLNGSHNTFKPKNIRKRNLLSMAQNLFGGKSRPSAIYPFHFPLVSSCGLNHYNWYV